MPASTKWVRVSTVRYPPEAAALYFTIVASSSLAVMLGFLAIPNGGIRDRFRATARLICEHRPEDAPFFANAHFNDSWRLADGKSRYFVDLGYETCNSLIDKQANALYLDQRAEFGKLGAERSIANASRNANTISGQPYKNSRSNSGRSPARGPP